MRRRRSLDIYGCRWGSRALALTLSLACWIVSPIQSVHAQLAPEIGYVHPAGGAASQAFDAVLGGYDWSPDMQVFSHDPRVKIEIVGAPSGVLVPDPPYWFGAKARGPAWPLPREFPARITIAADTPPSLVKWQVANANGASPVGYVHIGGGTQIVEETRRNSPQRLPSLPVTVAGQIRLIEEVDRYEFQTSQAGPVTISLVARQIGSPLHALIQVRDPAGRLILDVADTRGRDLAATFAAEAQTTYQVQLHDLDFAGDRSYVYRLSITAEPRVLAAFPARLKRGATQPVEFIGWGLATGAGKLESVTKEVVAPADATAHQHLVRIDTPVGPASSWAFTLGDSADQVEPEGKQGLAMPQLPMAVTGSLEIPFDSDEYSVSMAKDSMWQITAEAKMLDSPLDVELAVFGAEGKELARLDDSPATTDAVLAFKAPADGIYRVVVSERSGAKLGRVGRYRLAIEPQVEDFTANVPALLNVPLGGKAKLAIPLTRMGGFKDSVSFQFDGLPPGVKPIGELVTAAGKNDLTVEWECAADASATASLVRVSAKAKLGGQEVSRELGNLLMAITMKPPFKITPEGLDDVRKVHRGSTYLAPLLIERNEGFTSPITLEMTSKQQRHRQGLASGEFVVDPTAARVEYPIFVPEWMETTKTSRMILNGTVQAPDPQGKVRTLVQRMELRIGILPEGALMKVTHSADEPRVQAGGEVVIPVRVSRAPEFREPIRLELVASQDPAEKIESPAIVLAPETSDAELKVRIPTESTARGERSWTIRASAMRDGRWPVVSEATVLVQVQ
ncbi:MAG: hypothetical protein U1A77_13445 [Pirellulales bacterium]